MKKWIILIVVFVITHINIYGQSAISDSIALRIARRMKDSLGLSQAQEASIYRINQNLHLFKQEIRTRYVEVDSIRKHFQIIENTRDSLYRTELPESKYLLYLEKKRNLISGQ